MQWPPPPSSLFCPSQSSLYAVRFFFFFFFFAVKGGRLRQPKKSGRKSKNYRRSWQEATFVGRCSSKDFFATFLFLRENKYKNGKGKQGANRGFCRLEQHVQKKTNHRGVHNLKYAKCTSVCPSFAGNSDTFFGKRRRRRGTKSVSRKRHHPAPVTL